MSIIGITATVLSALVFISMCWAFGLWGGLIGTALVYPLIFLIGLGVSRRTTDGRLLDYWRAARAPLVGSIVSFYPMLLVHSAAQPLSLLLMRDTMIEHFGPANAGIWQASVRLSDMYTMVVLAALSMYSLPTLSAARGPTEFRHVLVRLVGGCLAVGMAAALTLFLARDLVVHFVFTHEFATVRDLWPWQLLGDVFLLAGWPMRSALTARQRSVTYMTIEAAIGVGLVVGTRLLVTHAGTLAASMAYALVWSTTFFVLLVVHWRTWQARTDGVPT